MAKAIWHGEEIAGRDERFIINEEFFNNRSANRIVRGRVLQVITALK